MMLSHRMRRLAISLSCAAVLVCASLAPASAQPATGAHSSPVPIRLGTAVVPLPGPWKFHIGDDPRWADPGYDDSAWETVDLTPAGKGDYGLGFSEFVPGWTRRGHPGYAGYAWYRLRVQTDAPGSPLALLMPMLVEDGYQLYADGREIGHFGDFSRHQPVLYYTRAKWFPLPSSAPGHPTQLALRFYMHPATPASERDAGGLHAPPRIGASGVIAALGTLARQRRFIAFFPYLLLSIVCGGFAFALLALYGLDRTEDVYLWFVLAYFAEALSVLLNFGVRAGIAELPMEFENLLRVLGTCWLLFVLTGWWRWFQLTDQRWLLRLVWAAVPFQLLVELAMFPPFLGAVVPFTAVPALLTVDNLVRLGVGLLFLVLVVFGIRRQGREGWLAFPAALLFAVALFGRELTLLHVPTGWTIFGLRISLGQMATLGLSAALGILIIRRFQRSQRRKQQLEADLRQAQQVQQVLLPQAIPAVPGFHIECEYRPAQEVGGDFFQVLETQAGGVLVVIGDVSGKGVQAAMLVALIVGALRTIAEDSENPSAILERLNRRLVGRMEGGLATCLCARLSPDGSLRVANAGHLAPWLDGQEMEVPHDLPLGLAEGIEYAARVLRLPENGTLSFVTDGVVEARNGRRELFGFDRTRALSTRSARQIAEAARQFGQEDDITVVRVQLSPVPALVLNV